MKTACQQACPAQAIEFGNLRDQGSRVVKAKADPRNYALLEELNTKPRTTYLAKVRNPNPELEGVPHDHLPLQARTRLLLGSCALMVRASPRAAARAAAPRAGPPIHLNPAWTTSRRCGPRRRARSSTTALPCGSRFPARSPSGELKERRTVLYRARAQTASFSQRVRSPRTKPLCARARTLSHLLPALPRRARRWQGHPVHARQRPDGVVPPGEDPEIYRRPDLRRDHQRRRADGRLPLADRRRPTAGRSSRTSGTCSDSERRRLSRGGGQVNGTMNRKLLFVLGPVTGLVMFAGVVFIVTMLLRTEYKEPYRAPCGGQSTRHHASRASLRSGRPRRRRHGPNPTKKRSTAGSRWWGAESRSGWSHSSTCSSRRSCWRCRSSRFIIEAIGYKTGDLRYDRLAYEFTKLLSVSFSLTATFGAFLTFMLIALYPKFTNYLMSVFSPTFLPYVLLFFAEAFFLYTYYYGWGKFHPLVHLGLGLGLNVVGTAIMFIANAWLTFMMSPQGRLRHRGADLAPGRRPELHVDADQRPSRHRERRVRRIGGRRVRGLQVPAGGDRRRARALRLDGLHRQLRRDHRVPARCPSPATGSPRRSTPTRRRSA